MRRQIALWKVLTGVLAVLALSSGGAVALAAVGGSPATQAQPETRGTLNPNRSTTFVPVTPCRIFSTTATETPFAIEATRNVKVFGNLSSQGGKAAGCGIPDAATGVEASVSATFNDGPGYIRAWPFGQSEPQATFVNYTASGASTNTGALTINPGGGNAFVLKNYRSTTDIIVDVQGYYIRPMYALVRADGGLQAQSGLTSVSKTGTGGYRVNFLVNTDSCSRVVTVGRHRITDPASSGFGSAHVTNAVGGPIQVETYDTAGSLADRAFMLEVTC
jgi:hypothetical protein